MRSELSALFVVTSSQKVAYLETTNDELFASPHELSRVSKFLFGDQTQRMTHVIILGGQYAFGPVLHIELFAFPRSEPYFEKVLMCVEALPHVEIGLRLALPARQRYRDLEYGHRSRKSDIRSTNVGNKRKR